MAKAVLISIFCAIGATVFGAAVGAGIHLICAGAIAVIRKIKEVLNMEMYNKPCECKITDAAPKPETVFNLLGESYDYARKALAMAVQINAYCFGKQVEEKATADPRCMRDAIAVHLDNLKALCEELDEILSGLGA